MQFILRTHFSIMFFDACSIYRKNVFVPMKISMKNIKKGDVIKVRIHLDDIFTEDWFMIMYSLLKSISH